MLQHGKVVRCRRLTSRKVSQMNDISDIHIVRRRNLNVDRGSLRRTAHDRS